MGQETDRHTRAEPSAPGSHGLTQWARSSLRGHISIHGQDGGGRKCASSPATASPSSSHNSRALAYSGPNL